jgi:hypothetical protein
MVGLGRPAIKLLRTPQTGDSRGPPAGTICTAISKPASLQYAWIRRPSSAAPGALELSISSARRVAAGRGRRTRALSRLDQRIEKGLVAKLEGIVGAEFVHMDYGEAIQVLERANEKFEFPVKPTCPRLRPSTPPLRLG